MHLYYGMKEKFEYTVENRDEVLKNIQDALMPLAADYDYVVMPESSSSFLGEVIGSLGLPVTKVQKNSLEAVKAFSDTLPLQKKERQAHHERFLEMGDVLKINKMKASQRIKYESVLFAPVSLPTGRGIIIDDSHFSGTTYRALKAIAPDCDFLAIFAK